MSFLKINLQFMKQSEKLWKEKSFEVLNFAVYVVTYVGVSSLYIFLNNWVRLIDLKIRGGKNYRSE